MAKFTLDNVASGYNRSKINNNFVELQSQLQNNVLYRNNPSGEPNQMENDLDMNSNDIANAKDIYTSRLKIGDKWVVAEEETSARDADTVTFDPSSSVFTSTDVQAALEEAGTASLYDAAEDFPFVVKTISDLQNVPSELLADGARFTVTEYAAGTGVGGGTLYWDASSTDTDDGGSVFEKSGVSTGRFKRIFSHDVSIEDFGGVAGQDCTLAGQAAMDYVSEAGGGVVKLPAGSVLISNSTSSHPNAAWLIPANIYLKGAGKHSTTITRPSGERGDNGVLIVNKAYDTNGGYTADGDIVLDGFTITDGATTPTRGLGDLIGLGHSRNVRIRNVHSGNHDQHFVDICSCDGVFIEESCSGDNEVQQGGSATIQVDGSDSLGIWGLLLDNTATKNVYIYGEKYRNTGADRAIELFHANNTDYENIVVDIDEVDGAYGDGQACIGIDSSGTGAINVTGLIVKCRNVVINHEKGRGCNLFHNPDAGKEISDVEVDVRIKSVDAGFAGFYAGVNGAGTYGRWKNVKVTLNIKMELPEYAATANSYGAKVLGIDGVYIDEKTSIDVSKATSTNLFELIGMEIDSCTGYLYGGRYHLDVPSGSPSTNYRCIWINKDQGITGDLVNFDISKPLVSCGSNIGYHIIATGGLEKTDSIKISGTRFAGTPTDVNIYEVFPYSDGTNGYGFIDLGGSKGELSVSSGQYLTGNTTGLKKSGSTDAVSPCKFEVQFANGTDDFGDNEEASGIWVFSTTSLVGIKIVDIDAPNGTFTIATGNDGVGVTVNSTTNEPLIRTSGRIKVLAGI